MIWIIVYGLLFLAVIYFYNWKQKRDEELWKHVMEIPGPKGYPLIGTRLEFYSPETLFLKDRERAKQYYPIYKKWGLGIPFVLIFSPEDVQLILSNVKHNTKSQFYKFLQTWLGTGLLTSSGQKWHKRRKIITPAFHFNILNEFIETIHTQAQFLVKNFREHSHQPYINVVKPLTEFALCSMGETALGIRLREHPKMIEYGKAVNDFGELFINRAVRPWLFFDPIYKWSSFGEKSKAVLKILHGFSRNVVKDKQIEIKDENSLPFKDKKRLALLDLLLKAKFEGADIDEEGIREELDTFIFAGHDTTSIALCYQLMLIANNPKIQDEIYEEIISVVGDIPNIPDNSNLGELKLMERCIKEGLRLYPSAPNIGRVAEENIKTKSGYTIPKGCNISIGIYDMHRSEHLWENPEKYDPDRFLPENMAKRHPFAFIPFSAGSRSCIGQKFAMLEMKIALCEILRYFKLVAYDRPEHMMIKPDLVLRPVSEIRVTFVPRS